MKSNYSYEEIPIIEKSRLYGKTNFPAIKTGSRILLYLLEETFKKFFFQKEIYNNVNYQTYNDNKF